MGHRARAALAIVFLASIGSVGCASPELHAARAGDRARLREAIGERHRQGRISNADAGEMAREVASREIATAPRDAALARVRQVRACAVELDDALAARAKIHDAAGAEAAQARIDGGRLDDDDAREFVGDRDDAWRSVGARGLVRREDHAARLRAFVDPAPQVRRGALRAAAVARDPSEIEALAEVARLDPELLLRNEAVRALGEIGGAATAAKLRDLWVTADEPLREDIATAWAKPGVYANGGREPLRLLLASGHGPGVIEGAAAALRLVPDADREVRDDAAALLLRTLADASRRDRLHALAVIPLTRGDAVDAVRKAASDDDVEVRVGALGRLLGVARERAAAQRDLEAIAGQEAYGTVASRARFELASAGDLRIQAWIERDLASPDAETRLSAADALAALGRAARGAPLLADDDARVRTHAACTLLVAARVHR